MNVAGADRRPALRGSHEGPACILVVSLVLTSSSPPAARDAIADAARDAPPGEARGVAPGEAPAAGAPAQPTNPKIQSHPAIKAPNGEPSKTPSPGGN